MKSFRRFNKTHIQGCRKIDNYGCRYSYIRLLHHQFVLKSIVTLISNVTLGIWVAEYRQRQAAKEQRLASLQDRLAGRENLSNW